MSNKIEFTVNSSSGIKEIDLNVYMIECKYIDPTTSDYITGNVILANKNISVFSRGCQTSVESIEKLMNELSTFSMDARIVNDVTVDKLGNCPVISELFMMDMRN